MNPARIEYRRIETLREFYTLMAQTRETRALVVEQIMAGSPPSPEHLDSLLAALSSLESIPETLTRDLRRILHVHGGKRIEVDLGYEFEELVKDIIFLRDGERALMDHMADLHDGFADLVEQGSARLRGKHFHCLITDRDGTINNPCGRYRSSVQSAWNGVLLSRFARNACDTAVCITTAPMTNPGILDVSVTPLGQFIYAASSGREFFTRDGERVSIPIAQEKQRLLDEMNEALTDLILEPQFETFGLIGSGLQRKFGQTTLARQDIFGSVRPEDSDRLLSIVREKARSLDPSERVLQVQDSGLDIEIVLAMDGEGTGFTGFDKGDGVGFLEKEAGLDLGAGPCLVCGDDTGDLAMLRAVLERSPDSMALFVSTDKAVTTEAMAACPGSMTAPSPDVLVSILGMAAG